ncbi:hypothetical protein [Salipiger marinus]|nr:hypothetical protein [Salipiger marinus]
MADHVRRFGAASSSNDLDGNRMIAFRSLVTGAPLRMELQLEGSVITRLPPVALADPAAETCAAAMRLGIGLSQASRYRCAEDIAAGRLVALLAATPPAPGGGRYIPATGSFHPG